MPSSTEPVNAFTVIGGVDARPATGVVRVPRDHVHDVPAHNFLAGVRAIATPDNLPKSENHAENDKDEHEEVEHVENFDLNRKGLAK